MNETASGGEALDYVEETIIMRLRWKFNNFKWWFERNWLNACDWLKWLGHEESNLEKYARRELEIAGHFKGDFGMGESTMLMIREFCREGHSGGSAPFGIGIFKKLASYEPLTPLTGADDEWNKVGEAVYQNKRCSHVFKNSFGGAAYDGEGKIFREPNGVCFTSQDSRVFIEFPYTPKREYVDVEVSDADRG